MIKWLSKLLKPKLVYREFRTTGAKMRKNTAAQMVKNQLIANKYPGVSGKR